MVWNQQVQFQINTMIATNGLPTTAIAGVSFYYHLKRPEFFATEGRLNAC